MYEIVMTAEIVDACRAGDIVVLQPRHPERVEREMYVLGIVGRANVGDVVRMPWRWGLGRVDGDGWDARAAGTWKAARV